MKVLIVNSRAYPHIGGVENSLQYIGKELILAGHQVKIFCFQMRPDEPLRCEHGGIEIIRAPQILRKWPHTRLWSFVDQTKSEIKKVIKEFNPDAIWSRTACIGLGAARSGFNGPIVQIYSTAASMDCKGLYLQTTEMPISRRLMLLMLWPLHYQAAYFIERELIKKSVSVVFSKNMQNQLTKCYSLPSENIHIIPPGVNTERFSFPEGQRLKKTVCELIGLDPNGRYVLYVGRFSEAKNIPLLIRAMARLDSDIKLLLVGDGPEKERLQLYINKINMKNRVIFAGSHSELLPGFYSLAKVCVLPTTIESFGQVLIESLACGTPVVGFKENGKKILTAISEIIKDGQNGYCVEIVSEKALAQCLKKIFDMPLKDYFELSRFAFEDSVKRYSWNTFVNKMLSLHHS